MRPPFLVSAIWIAEARVLGALDCLNKIDPACEPIQRSSLEFLLMRIKHVVGDHTERRVIATAYFRELTILYNPIHLRELEALLDSDGMLEIVLHEVGHLLAWHYFTETGHGPRWVQIGEVLGYRDIKRKLPEALDGPDMGC